MDKKQVARELITLAKTLISGDVNTITLAKGIKAAQLDKDYVLVINEAAFQRFNSEKEVIQLVRKLNLMNIADTPHGSCKVLLPNQDKSELRRLKNVDLEKYDQRMWKELRHRVEQHQKKLKKNPPKDIFDFGF